MCPCSWFLHTYSKFYMEAVVIAADCPWKGWWHSPNPWPQVLILCHMSVQVLGRLSYLRSQATKSFSDFFWQNFLFVIVGPALAWCRIRPVPVPTQQEAAGVGLPWGPSQPNPVLHCPGAEKHKRTSSRVTWSGLVSPSSTLTRCRTVLSHIWFFFPW